MESLCFKKKNYVNEEILEEVLKKAKHYLIKKFDDKKNVTSFVKQIIKVNHSKYNTEKCLQDFYKEISIDCSENWRFKKNDFNKICKLRNDITHANDYKIIEREFMEYTMFIEVLLLTIRLIFF